MNPLTVLVLAIAVTTAAQCRADLIDDTCAHTPYPEACKSAVRSDPRGGTDDVAKLGLIVVDKLADSSNKDVVKIKSLIGSEKDPKVKKALTVCSDNYKFILESLIGSASQAFSFGNPKFAEDAMNESKRVTEECESGFDGKSPITAENTVAKELSAVASGIARLLL